MEINTGEGRQPDQLGFFLFIALALHIMAVLGFGLSGLKPGAAAAPQLEVVLAWREAEAAPEDARFIAQSNQRGDDGERMPFAAALTAAPVPASASVPESWGRDSLVATRADAAETTPVPAIALSRKRGIQALDASIADLEAKLGEQQRAYAERPRVRRISDYSDYSAEGIAHSAPAAKADAGAAPSTKAAVGAAYLRAWRERIEAVGNRDYPLASSRYGIYGDLRLLAAVRRDGTVARVEILASSGHAVLDEAAIRILREAAPFAPFPPALSAEADVLEIIRTWKFREGGLRSVRD